MDCQYDGGVVAKSYPTLATPWAVACQAFLSMGFSRQEYWSGLLFPTPEDLPDPGIEPWSPALRADSLLTEPPGKPKEFPKYVFFKSPLKWLWFYTLKGEFFRL